MSDVKDINSKKMDVEKDLFEDSIGISKNFSALGKLILRDLNNNTESPNFYLYTKDQIVGFIKDPNANQESLRNAVIYVYNASSHFKRLIQYFTGLNDFSYVVSPSKINTATASPKSIARNYRKTLNILTGMDIKNQFSKVLTVCLREDVFYGTLWVVDDVVTLQQLPSEYCRIATIEGNVFNVTFDFSYFTARKALLDFYPAEFRTKYEAYQKDRRKLRWQELDSPNSFAVKSNTDIVNYAIPPFVGILRDVYDLEDYKGLKLTKQELENYALLAVKLGINENGEWELPFEMAKKFWQNLDSVLPEEVGSVLTPMDIEKISFERTHADDADSASEAEESIYSSAGVSSLLFNNKKASSSALLLSIKVDQAFTYSIVKNIESVINRFIQSQSYGKNFRINILDCSPFNRKEAGDAYLKACTYGIPMISYYAASQGMGQAELDCMNFLENDVLHFRDRFMPLQSSNTQSGSDGEVGRTEKDIGELTEAGEAWREL